jgi:hypothetical protein
VDSLFGPTLPDGSQRWLRVSKWDAPRTDSGRSPECSFSDGAPRKHSTCSSIISGTASPIFRAGARAFARACSTPKRDFVALRSRPTCRGTAGARAFATTYGAGCDRR